jgi:hypothetical protein
VAEKPWLILAATEFARTEVYKNPVRDKRFVGPFEKSAVESTVPPVVESTVPPVVESTVPPVEEKAAEEPEEVPAVEEKVE